MTTPAWDGATTGQRALAGQINQFLGTHASTIVFPGAVINQQLTAGSGGTNTNSTWLAQQFTSGSSTAMGRVTINIGFTGTPTPLTLSIYANSAGAPTGSALNSTVVPNNYLTAAGASVSIPLPTTLTASTTYWLVIPAVGDVSDFYTWNKSNQTSGASTSTNGTSWTAQTYGFIFSVTDQTVSVKPVHIWEDAGVKWNTMTYNTNGTIATLREYTVAQGSNQFVYSSRSFTYSGTILTSIS